MTRQEIRRRAEAICNGEPHPLTSEEVELVMYSYILRPDWVKQQLDCGIPMSQVTPSRDRVLKPCRYGILYRSGDYIVIPDQHVFSETVFKKAIPAKFRDTLEDYYGSRITSMKSAIEQCLGSRDRVIARPVRYHPYNRIDWETDDQRYDWISQPVCGSATFVTRALLYRWAVRFAKNPIFVFAPETKCIGSIVMLKEDDTLIGASVVIEEIR